ncbi:MAG: hypothetical protein PHU21_14795 [Elusimicrobia bacterium]|nr:hypothetical protein [Elusimicrobiota bacterium]
MLPTALLAAALAAAPVFAQDALSRAGDASAVSGSAASAGSPTQAKELSALAFQGGTPAQTVVRADGRGVERSNLTLQRGAAERSARSAAVPGPGRTKSSGLPPVPGPFSFLSKTALGVAAGVATGLAAAWLFTKKHYAAGIGVAAGSIAGALIAGPIGALVGGLIGGLLGHFGARLFKKG